jgi:hypothetical protein
MKASEALEQKILAYIDKTLNEKDRAEFEQMLLIDQQLKQRVEQLRDINAIFRNERLQEPSRNFTRNVMENLHHYPLRDTPVIFNSILLLSGVIALVGICIALLYFGFFDTSQTSINLNSVNLVNKYIHKTLPSIPLDGKVIVNAVIFLNLVLALIVFDRAILKPLFQRRVETGA